MRKELAPPSATRRRFKLVDVMILVASTSVGLAVDGWLNSLTKSQGGLDTLDILGSYFGARQYPQAGALAMILTVPVAVAWTLALIPLGLVQPRPRLRRLSCRPGWIGCCAFGLALACISAVTACFVAITGPAQVDGLLELSPLLPTLLAPAILASWLSLVLGRRWRAEPSWLDRSGRALGVAWVVLAVAGPILLMTADF